MNYIFRVYYS